MKDLKFDGVGAIASGDYGSISIDGIGKCKGDLKAERLKVDGIFRCLGAVRAGRFECDGIAKIAGNVQAGEIDIDGILEIRGGTKLEATTIDCDGIIRIDGEISADRIVADGIVRAREIVGENIRIRSPRYWPLFFLSRKRSRIPLIEATTIDLAGVTAVAVNGRDITIGPRCRIDRVDCSGTLVLAKGARVREISGDHVRHDA